MLIDKLNENEKVYVYNFEELKIKSEQRFKDKLVENQYFNKEKNYIATILEWLFLAFESIENSNFSEDFWKKITLEFSRQVETLNYKKKNDCKTEIKVYNKTINSIVDLKIILVEEFEKMLIQRERTLDEIVPLFEKDGKKDKINKLNLEGKSLISKNSSLIIFLFYLKNL